jgi:biopolymer transport protein ExbD
VIECRAVAIELPARRRRAAALSLAPLIDVILVALLLFVLVIRLGQITPAAITFNSEQFNVLSGRGEHGAGGANPLTVTLNAGDALYLWDGRRIGIGELSAVLQEQMGSIILTGAATPPVVIAPEPEVPLQTLIEVMRIAQSNAFFKTHIVMPKLAAEATGK